jgi:hypothetical protein
MEKIKRKYLELILGIILLMPPVLSVLFFTIQLIPERLKPGLIKTWDTFSDFRYTAWTGNILGDGGGFTSALPIYLGLMAIAGALLITNSTKK